MNLLQLNNDIKKNMTINKECTGRLILSLGTKFSGKTFFILKWLQYCFAHNHYDKYYLVLPSYKIEANDSYSFIDPKASNILIFEEYHANIPKLIMKDQLKRINSGKQKNRALFIVDDASGENVFYLDSDLKKLITSVRHFNCIIYMIAHAAAGILSPFLRSQCDVLFLYNLTNQKLLESIFIEFLSLTQTYRKNDTTHKNMNVFITDFLKLHTKPYQCLYLNLRDKTSSTQLCKLVDILKKHYK